MATGPWGFDASAAEALLAALATERPAAVPPLSSGGGGGLPSAAPSDNVYVANLPTAIDDETLQQVFSVYGVVTQCKAMPNSKGFAGAGLVRFASPEEAAWVVENVAGTMPAGFTEPVIVKFANPKGKGKGKDGGGGYGKGQENSAWRSSPYGKSGPTGDSGKGSWPDDAVNGHGSADTGNASWGTDVGEGHWGADAAWDGGNGPTALATPAAGKGQRGKEASVSAIGIKMIVDGLCASGCLPGGEKYTNDSNALFVGGLPPDTTDLELYKMFASFGGLAPKGVSAMRGREGCKGIGFVNFMEESAAQAAIGTLNGCILPNGTVLKVSIKREGSAKGKDKGEKGKGKSKSKGKCKDSWVAQGKGGWSDFGS